MISGYLLPLADHLWQSTLFVAIVWLLTCALRKNRAAVRHRLWLVASAKFLIPFSLLTAVGSSFPWQTHSTTPVPSVPAAIERMGERISSPFTAPEPATELSGYLSNVPTEWIPEVLVSIWACGVAASLIAWAMGWMRVRRSLRSAVPLNLSSSLRVVSSSECLEPGVFGIFKPVLLLPDGIIDRLSPAQIQLVLAHELCHVRRRDNLTSATHMVVEALFWFHPLVWWIKARLLEERERACDEEVLGFGANPQIYAESILKICEFHLTTSSNWISAITGSDLKGRIEEIMSTFGKHKLSFGKTLLLASAALIAIVLPIAIGSLSAPAHSFEDFLQDVDQGKISKVTLVGSKLTGTLNEKGETVESAIPSDSSAAPLYDRLIKANVQVTVLPADGPAPAMFWVLALFVVFGLGWLCASWYQRRGVVQSA